MTEARVLVTGGTGYLGTALVRALLAAEAPQVVAFSHAEEPLRRLRAAEPDPRLACWLGDVRDAVALDAAVRTHRVTAILHAAAVKAVPLCERYPLEAIATNVGGTAEVVAVAQAHGLSRVVGISSDKALEATGVYGATKLALERLLVAAGFMAVRLGNLIGSTGSVLPIWREQRAAGQPITVTDPAMTRFYVTRAEAVGFVLRVLSQGQPSAVYVPKLRACPLWALADAVSPQQQVVGARPGEHRHEVLLLPYEPAVDVEWAWEVRAGHPACGTRYVSSGVADLPAAAIVEAG